MKRLLAFGLMMAMCGLGGCALTVRDVHVDYKYTKVPITDLSNSPEKVRIGKFDDSRGMDNPRMIMHSQNMYGNTMSGGTQAEKPVAEIVRDGVAQALAATHARIVEDDPSLILSGDLMEYSYSLVQGGMDGNSQYEAHGQAQTRIKVRKYGVERHAAGQNELSRCDESRRRRPLTAFPGRLGRAATEECGFPASAWRSVGARLAC